MRESPETPAFNQRGALEALAEGSVPTDASNARKRRVRVAAPELQEVAKRLDVDAPDSSKVGADLGMGSYEELEGAAEQEKLREGAVEQESAP